MLFFARIPDKGIRMKKGPAFSVIIPVYNVAPYLRQCLNSVLFQDFQDLEIICIDDGSTDQSYKILKSYQQKHKKIQIIHQENQGVSVARNIGLKKASGEFIYFLDSDDYIAQNTLTKVYALLKSHNLDMLHITAQQIDERGNEIPTAAAFKMPFIPPDKKNKILAAKDTYSFVFQMSVNPGLSFFKRSFLNKNKIIFPKGIRFEDNPFFFKAVLCASRLMLVDEPLYFYRSSPLSVTNAKDERQFDLIKAYQCVYTFLKEKKLCTLLSYSFLERQMTRLFDTWLTIRSDLKNEFVHRCGHYFQTLNLPSSHIEKLPLRLQFFYNMCRSEQTSPSVTIIVSAYHTMPFLEKCFKSFYAQSFVNFELICFGAEKNEKNNFFIKKWSFLDNRISFQETGFNLAQLRNKGLRLAKGEYILFWDGFDYVDWRFLERMLSQIKQKNADVCICQTKIEDMSSKQTKTVPQTELLKKKDIDPSVYGPVFYNALFKTSFLRVHHLTFTSNQAIDDRRFWTTFFQYKPVCATLHWVLTYHILPPVRDVFCENMSYFNQKHIYYPVQSWPQKLKRFLFCLPSLFYNAHIKAMRQMHHQQCPIVFISDDHYAVPTLVTLASLKQTKKTSTKYDIFIIAPHPSRDFKNALKKLCSTDFKIRLVRVKNRYRSYQKSRNPITTTALLKFDIPHLFKTYDRILYLDSDIIATQDLSQLLNFPLTDVYAAVVKDMVAHFDGNLERLHLFAYFNSGVMLFNLHKMRQDLMTDQLIQLKKADPWQYFMDQDTFNVAFQHKVSFISPHYNYMLENRLYSKRVLADFYGLTHQEVLNLLKKPILIHYSSQRKPWKIITSYHDMWMQSYSFLFQLLHEVPLIAGFHENLRQQVPLNQRHKVFSTPSSKKDNLTA